jgi:hypothetical protein
LESFGGSDVAPLGGFTGVVVGDDVASLDGFTGVIVGSDVAVVGDAIGSVGER